jgi:hypothetical protein
MLNDESSGWKYCVNLPDDPAFFIDVEDPPQPGKEVPDADPITDQLLNLLSRGSRLTPRGADILFACIGTTPGGRR